MAAQFPRLGNRGLGRGDKLCGVICPPGLPAGSDRLGLHLKAHHYLASLCPCPASPTPRTAFSWEHFLHKLLAHESPSRHLLLRGGSRSTKGISRDRRRTEQETWACTDFPPHPAVLSLCLGQRQQDPGVFMHCQPFVRKLGTSSELCDNWLGVWALQK